MCFFDSLSLQKLQQRQQQQTKNASYVSIVYLINVFMTPKKTETRAPKKKLRITAITSCKSGNLTTAKRLHFSHISTTLLLTDLYILGMARLKFEPCLPIYSLNTSAIGTASWFC